MPEPLAARASMNQRCHRLFLEKTQWMVAEIFQKVRTVHERYVFEELTWRFLFFGKRCSKTAWNSEQLVPDNC